MDDDRVWDFEKSLWTGDAEHYRTLIDDACLMVVPAEPYVLSGQDAVKAVADTTRWSEVAFSGGRISRPDEGWIVVAYTAHASRPGRDGYVAHCTSTYRRLEHDEWRMVQHQQTPPLQATGHET
jgi:hypothetical protein